MSSEGISYQEPLIYRIRNLINGYDRGALLKEYLQNADDSRATELIVTFDRRTHKKLKTPLFDVASGPSLILQNNSSFDDKDFESIVKLSAQGKIDDPSSTGRFGQGFTSSFSVSDDPSFISAGRAYWFDLLHHGVSKGEPEDIRRWLNLQDVEIKDWLDAFPINDLKNFDGTVFRLPLRQNESSNESQISDEVFTFDDFLLWVDEWREKSQSLLFLRNIHKLVLAEIDELGNKKTHLIIETQNSDKLESINENIQQYFDIKDSLQVCKDWLATGTPLPLFEYEHIFKVTYFKRDERKRQIFYEKWAVVNGLFRGKQNGLIKQAIEALSIKPEPRKVMPWAGVAVLLNEDSSPKPCQNPQLYTFLPLPIENPYPIHIHGWFDLDSTRTEITHRGEGKAKASLIEWNELLMTEAVGVAWAKLVEFVKNKNHINAYYDIWPKPNDFQFSNQILDGYYNEVGTQESIFCISNKGETWERPSEKLFWINEHDDQNLLDALKEHFQLVIGNAHKYIRDNLKQSGNSISVITPSGIRDYLRKETAKIAFPHCLEDIPLAMLRQKKWFLSLVTYCAGNNQDYSLIEDLPLSLSIDGKVYESSHFLLVDTHPNLKVLQSKTKFVMDTDLAEKVKGSLKQPQNWLEDGFESTIKVMVENFDEFKVTEEWIREVICYISDASVTQINQSINEISKLSIVIQDDGHLGSLAASLSQNPPILVRKSDLQDYQIIKKLHVNLIRKDVVEIYRPLEKHPKLINQYSPELLIRHILTTNDFSFCDDEVAHGYVIEVLSSDITWVDNLNTKEVEAVKKIPFIKTDTGSFHSLGGDTQLFIGTGFETPQNIHGLNGNYELVSCFLNSYREMLKRLGVQEQTAANYLTDIIIPFFTRSTNSSEKQKALDWLVSNWKEIKQHCDDDETSKLLASFKSTPIIPRESDGVWLEPKEMYHPQFFRTLPNIFRISGAKPKPMDILAIEWDEFLHDVGTSKKLITKFVVNKIESIIELTDVKSAIDFWNYVIANYDEFIAIKRGNSPLIDEYLRRPCFPVAAPKGLLIPDGEAPILANASYLITPRDKLLLGGVFFSIHEQIKLDPEVNKDKYPSKKMAEHLGLIDKPHRDRFFQNFHKLVKMEAKDRSEEKQILKMAKAFYRYVGRTKLDYIPASIKESSIRIGSMWIDSKDVFQDKVDINGIYNWNSLISSESDSQIRDGLIQLGVNKSPSVKYMSQQIEKRYETNVALAETKLKEVRSILNWLSKNLEELIETAREFPVLTIDNCLAMPSGLFINDLPAYNIATSKNEKLRFVASEYGFLANHFGAVRLSENLELKLNPSKSKHAETNVADQFGSLDTYVRQEYVRKAFLRLYAHEKRLDEETIKETEDKQFIPDCIDYYDKLVIDSEINNVWIYTNDKETTYLDSDSSTLCILVTDNIDEMCEQLALYIQKNAELDGSMLFILCKILQMQSGSKDLEGFLDRKSITALPSYILPSESELIIEEYSETDEINRDDDFEYEHYENFVHENNTVIEKEASSETESKVEEIIDDESLGSTNVPKSVDQNTNGRGVRIKGTLRLNEIKSKRKVSDSNRTSDESASTQDVPPPIKPKLSKETSLGETISPRNGDAKFTPGSGVANFDRSKVNNKTSANNRLPVYVGSDSDNDDESIKAAENLATKLGDKGEDFIISHSHTLLTSPNNVLVKAERNQEGFDISEKDPEGNIVRYIEVKTVGEKWGDCGVALSKPQWEFAMHNDNWWLFVVENMDNEFADTSIYRFKNPVRKVNKFMFDRSWEAIADESLECGSKNMPEPTTLGIEEGQRYKLPTKNKIYEVINVSQKGFMTSVELLDPETNEQFQKNYSHSWEKQ
jgi:hypothetical protein